MIECYKTQSGWYVVRCSSCDMEMYFEDVTEAEHEGTGHEEMHDMARDLNRYFGLVGASIAYKLADHFHERSLS